jgi:predicted NUDIX family phosphoesterase
MTKVQQVLVVPRTHLDSLGKFQGFLPGGNDLLDRLLSPSALRFLDRPAAEEDPGHKQLIPYMMIRHAGRFLGYTRGKKGSETRLHALRSIGIGGHVEPCDGPAHDSLSVGMTRELREEIHVDGDLGVRFLGLINDDSNAVGMVHLGLAYLVDVAAEPLVADLALVDPRMESLGLLRANGDRHETWSRLLLDDPEALTD